ncbi:uncharacterized protein LOC122536030 [Frieseomelitta varia]|uniref:uncharacterized protein LOC122536030 n=1 Tax=Frieseomelitta varia TaxID=561572 RepID=UPI001CB67F42|nr:uncharacterized protein LOC122536030 [Frieseomelitta varia]XP_043523981.1 uncharacterized protein LOC122536030 [Frieseomelitta varia]XP_043523982.1 uncharacterized protein LOC122536030 [Frieseomelitta varia]XP_043523983.1 uncharacterized protein LOC122536030 [Frieseomelitta varia]
MQARGFSGETMPRTKDVLVKLCILLLLYERATCLVIPEELPTILSLVYSNIPPIKKGTDSRIGVGFRLGEHADFQILLELGPQTETESIGNADSKRRRDAMLSAAMKGELGPLAQAVAKYQLERKLQKELEKSKKTGEKLNTVVVPGNDDKKTAASEWLTKWSKEMGEDKPSLDDVSAERDNVDVRDKPAVQRIGQPPVPNDKRNAISDLKKLYESRNDTETDKRAIKF